ncbi:MAG TPA: NAD-dependent epimerase/dehydratase family protein, partial [Bacteroidetes bacterium]|nr:NAD-dependent epimerase/dehydratase family protein [Bacteroidota bacterium]
MDRVKILIVGSNGLLGQKAVQTFRKNYEVVTGGIEAEPFVNHDLAYHHLDITDWRSLQRKIVEIDPRIIFNAAAYTQVDRAETERELCYAVNVTGVKNLAKICKAQDAELIHISTDYVFDGVKGNYSETDEPNPLG